MSLTNRQVRLLLIVGVVIGLTVAPAASTISALVDNTSPVNDVTLHAPDGPAATFEVQTDADLTNFSDPNTVYFKSAAANVTVSSQGRTDVRLTQLVGAWTNLTNINAGSRTLTVNPEDKRRVEISGGVTALDYRADADTYLGSSHVSFVYSADSSGEVTLHSLPASTEFTAATKSGTNLGSYQTDSSGSATINVESASDAEVILFTNHAPEADDLGPPDGTELDSSTVDFTADVSDEEFSTAQSDEVQATLFVDGESVGSQTVTSNQTVTVTHELSDGGDHTYYWEIEDSYGETTTTATQTVTVPATLEIRDVTDTDKLVNADNATVTFYGGDNERQIVERDASNGTVSLDGLPTDTEFTVVVRADDYYTRQTIIPSLYDQSNVWMLPKNDTDAVEIVFLLDDRTGDFANSDETQLRVQRAIEHNNSTEWRDVVGDDISATAELATILQNQERYRLVISNEVQTRILGSYTPSGPADPETIPIGRIDFQGDSEKGTAFDAALVNETQPGIEIMYRDPDTTADSLTFRILNTTTENTSVVVPNTTISNPDAFTSITEALPDDTTLEDSTFRVELWAYAEDGTLIEKRQATVGKISGPDFGDGVNNGILTLTGYLLLVGIGFGTGNYSPKLGVLSAVIVGASLTIFNVVAIPHVVLGFTGTIALIVNAADRT
jgi:hypothetical protein